MNKRIALILVFSGFYLGVSALETKHPFSFYPKYPCENCWERCFSNPPDDSFVEAYARLYKYFSRVQSDRILSGAKSSVLLEDITIAFPRVILQKNLMKLAAFALNSGPSCHPTALGGYGRFGSFLWVAVNAQCPTACQMVYLIDELPTFPVVSPNPLGLACLAADTVMNETPFKCDFSQDRYALAFTNDAPQILSNQCLTFPVRLEVATDGSSSPYAPGFTTTSGGVHEEFLPTPSNLVQASQQLVNCIRKRCCYYKPWFQEEHELEALEVAKGRSGDNRSEDFNEGTIYYVDANEPTEVKQTKGNLKEFVTKKEKEADPCVIIPSEDGETGEGCMGDLCNNPTYAEQCPQNCRRCRRG